MTARVYCALLLCLSGCLGSTEAAPGLNLTAGKPRVFPSREYEMAVCAELCVNDSDCPKNEKCCSNGCGHECIALYAGYNPGVCPSKRYTAEECDLIRYVRAPTPCADDRDCAKNEKCCHNGCGLQCMAPVKVKPGVCPSKRYTTKECTWIRFVSCADDSECVKNEKCCHNGCGLQCMAPVTAVKPGVCPSGKIEAAVCAVTRFRWMCDHDSDCANNEKCCHNGCVLQCMAPVTAVKPGVCPSRRYTTKECARIRFMLCADDSECVKNEKCCHNGCGLQCMAPVTVKPGVCPSKRYTTKDCARIRFVPCVNDSDCVKNEKCCHNGCGLQCMAPVKVPFLDSVMVSALPERNDAQPPVVTHAVNHADLTTE